MRFVADFFSGIRSGLGAGRAAVFRTPAGFKPRKPNGPPPAHPVISVVFRAGLLMLAVGLGAAGLYSISSIKPKAQRCIPVIHPGVTPTLPDEILATDPDVPMREWKYIVLHHSASVSGSAEIFDQIHRTQRHWDCLGYDFVIGNGAGQGDGEIVTGPRWYEQKAGAHANSKEYNDHGIGICLIGNFETSSPTPQQMMATQLLVNKLCRMYHIPAENIVGHSQVRCTACPGKLFPLMKIRADAE